MKKAFLFFLGLFSCFFLSPKFIGLNPQLTFIREINAAVMVSRYASASSNLMADFSRAIREIKEATLKKQRGQVRQAIAHWEKAASIYRANNNENKLAAVLTDMAQAYVSLGQPNPAIELLHEAIKLAQKNGELRTATVAVGILGNAYFLSGDISQALAAYSSSLESSTALNNPTYMATASNSLGKIYQARGKQYSRQALLAQREGDTDEELKLKELAIQDRHFAEKYLTSAVKLSSGSSDIVAALALIDLASFQESELLQGFSQINESGRIASAILEALPDSLSQASALIRLASLDALPQALKIQHLEKAIAVAKNLGDARTQSYAEGALGQVYEAAKEYERALSLTRSAIWKAQQVNAPDSLYRWLWQAGRIYQATGLPDAAISTYQQALAILQTIRGDLVAASLTKQFDKRDEVEPIYRELIGLLLQGEPTRSKIEQAQTISSLLKLAQLQDYFGDECLQIKDVLSRQQPLLAATAQIQSIVLADMAYLIVRLNNGSLSLHPVSISAEDLEKNILEFRQELEDASNNRYLASAAKLYELLVRPIEPELTAASIKNLVFINDGLLQNIPMSALYDGDKFLIEKYSVAASLGFELSQRREHLDKERALIFGLTVEIPPLAPLEGVARETQQVQGILGGNRFLDSDFTVKNLRTQVQTKNSPILHLATHGKFGATSESTFLQAFDARINLEQFEEILSRVKQPIDLLTLSACQTATGDNRSTLGLAGVAVRSGVRNVLATLWSVNDADTVGLIEDFYNFLKQPGATPISALRETQIKSIKSGGMHPATWSSFILINNGA